MNDQIRFYLDEHVHSAIAAGLRARGVGVLTVTQAGLIGATDRQHLEFAKENQYVVFTHDADFLRLHMHTESVPHAGIVYASRQLSIGETIRKLMLIFEILTSTDMEDHVEFI